MKLSQAGGSSYDDELHLFPRFDDPDREKRLYIAVPGSVLAHVAAVAVLMVVPAGPGWRPPEREVAQLQRVTPLVMPAELTQRDPNRGKLSEEFELHDLLPPTPVTRRGSQAQNLPVPPIPAPVPEVKRAPIPAPVVPTPEPPQLAANIPELPPGPPLAGPELAKPMPPQQIQQEEQAQPPKIAFESPRSAAAARESRVGSGAGASALPLPGASVNEAMRDIARGQSSGGLVVGDLGLGSGGLGGSNQPGSQGRVGSSVELLSDPQGVDFKPYLIQILASVRRNWFAVIPESARMGRTGKVQILFAINKDGRVPKLVIASPSGLEALDRAAVAGISASNPFPPLPNEFKGNQIRLQFTFSYATRRVN
jgi:TonB family protein